LAAAAIVVVDFVSHWLLRKLRGPASKIGARIKVIAKKIMAKIKAVAKKVGAALKKVAKKIGGVFKKGKKKFDAWRAKRKAKKDAKKAGKQEDASQKKKDKEKAKQDKLDSAVTKVTPKVQALLRKGISGLALKAKLALLGFTHGLSSLKLKGDSIEARVNPKKEVTRAEQLKLGGALESIIQAAEREFLAAYDRAREKEAAGGGLEEHDPTWNPTVDTLREFKDAEASGSGLDWELRKRKDKGGRKSIPSKFVAWMRASAGGAAQFIKYLKTGSSRSQAKATGAPEDPSASLVTTIVAMGGSGAKYKDIAKSESSLDFSDKTKTLIALEGARQEGIMTSLAVSTEGAKAELGATPASQQGRKQKALVGEVLDKNNPMAPEKSAVAAAAEKDLSVLEGRSEAQKEKIARASDERKRRIAQIFLNLRQSMQNNKELYGDGSSALTQVVKAFSDWFAAQKPGSGVAADEIAAKATMLKTKLVLFLKNFSG